MAGTIIGLTANPQGQPVLPPTAKADLAADIANPGTPVRAALDAAGLGKGAADADIAAMVQNQTSATGAALSATYATKTELSGAGMRVVYHMTDATTARPDTVSPVLWVGSVPPANRVAGDMYFESSAEAAPPSVAWLAQYTASSLSLANATAVATWADESGNGNDLAQATAASQPTFYAATDTSPAYVRFPGAHSLVTQAFAAAGTQPFTIIVAARHNTVNTATGFNTVATGLTAGQFVLRGRGNGAGAAFWSAEAGTSINHTQITAGQWYIVSVIFDGTTSTIRVNGSSIGVSPGTNAFTGLRVGSSYTGASSFFNGDLHALRLFQGRLEDPDRLAVEQSLADSVGVTLA